MVEGRSSEGDASGALAATPDPKERLRLYLAPLLDIEAGRYALNRERALTARAGVPFDRALKRSPAYADKLAYLRQEHRRAAMIRDYYNPVSEAHKRAEVSRRYQLVLGDSITPSPSPTFHKARKVEGCGLDVIVPMQRDRHFGRIRHVAEVDQPFDRKVGKVVWRGATTGRFQGASLSSRYYVYERFAAISAVPDLDIGFSEVTGAMAFLEATGFGPVERCIKPALSMEEQLQYKYLLSLEGNDAASGLKWMLASNSVVLMPRPTILTWACETLLVPGVHYVEVKHDLSNLEEVYAWCERNQAQCREISRNARAFILPFADKPREMELFDRVVRRFHRRVRLYDPAAEEGGGGRA